MTAKNSDIAKLRKLLHETRQVCNTIIVKCNNKEMFNPSIQPDLPSIRFEIAAICAKSWEQTDHLNRIARLLNGRPKSAKS